MTTGCVFCDAEGGTRLWRDARCRIVLTDEAFPGFCWCRGAAMTGATSR
jgi:hypothetical protein